MSNLRQSVTSAIGRLVWGNMTDAQTKDAEGKPLVIKNGPDAGKPTQRYAFGVAIAKTPGVSHWANEPGEFFKAVWAVGHAAFPNGQAQRPDFAWKILDGDSTIPNKKGKKPCDQEGHKGHWIVTFSSSFAPKTCSADGTNRNYDPRAIKTGHYVQVMASVDGNNSPNQPGVYLNHEWVAHSGFGDEIHNGADPSQAGFGKAPAPVGMSAVPVGGLPGIPAPVAAAPLPTAPLPTPTAVAAHVAVVAPLPTPTAVQPHPSILNVPAVPVATQSRQMTAKANGVTYEQFIGTPGWTDDLLRSQGYMV